MEFEIMMLCNSLGLTLVFLISMLSIVGFTEEANSKVLKFEQQE